MKIFFFFYGLLLLCAISLSVHSMDWPQAEARILKNFGSNNSGTASLCDTFAGEGPVLTSSAGELLFQRSQENQASRLPSANGAFVALDHGDNMITVYGHLQNEQRSLPAKINTNDVIGFSGTSGIAKQDGFSFSIFDRKEKRWVNPSLIIKTEEEERAPQLVKVLLRDMEGKEFDLALTRNVPQGRMGILVHAEDTRESYNDILMPQKIVCSVNGMEAGILAFETIYARNGKLVMYRNGLVLLDQVYIRAPAIEAGDFLFTRGQALLDIIIEDIAGNSRKVQYRLFVE